MAIRTQRVRAVCIACKPPFDHIFAILGGPWVDTLAGKCVTECAASLPDDRPPVVDAAELFPVRHLVVAAVGTGPSDRQFPFPCVVARQSPQ